MSDLHTTKTKLRGVWLLALYASFAISFHGFFCMKEPSLWILPFSILVLHPLFFYCFQAVSRFSEKFPALFSIPRRTLRLKLSLKLFLWVSLGVFCLLALHLLAYIPGGVSFDNYRQWKEVQTMRFEDWHPAFHTMLIWLVTRLCNRYFFFLLVQSGVFSLCAGWMTATLHAWGIPKLWIGFFVLTLMTVRSTRGILLFAWKDAAFMVALLALAVLLINIYFSHGTWLESKKNIAGLIVALIFVTLLRHNGLFFSVPILLVLFFTYLKLNKKLKLKMNSSLIVQNLVTLLLCVCVAATLIKGPLYYFAHVAKDPTQGYVEAVGVPMTILSSVYRLTPEVLDPETTAFLQSLATEEQWSRHHVFGNYNAIKWSVNTNPAVAKLPPKKLLLMTARTVYAAPLVSLRAVTALTQFVWDPNVYAYTVDFYRDMSFQESVAHSIHEETERTNPPRTDLFLRIEQTYRGVTEMLFPTQQLQSIGTCMLLLVCAGALALLRPKNQTTGTPWLFLLPVLCYNLGTMLLLCGGDYRFFQWNAVVTVPFVLALLSRPAPDPMPKPSPEQVFFASSSPVSALKNN